MSSKFAKKVDTLERHARTHRRRLDIHEKALIDMTEQVKNVALEMLKLKRAVYAIAAACAANIPQLQPLLGALKNFLF